MHGQNPTFVSMSSARLRILAKPYQLVQMLSSPGGLDFGCIDTTRNAPWETHPRVRGALRLEWTRRSQLHPDHSFEAIQSPRREEATAAGQPGGLVTRYLTILSPKMGVSSSMMLCQVDKKQNTATAHRLTSLFGVPWGWAWTQKDPWLRMSAGVVGSACLSTRSSKCPCGLCSTRSFCCSGSAYACFIPSVIPNRGIPNTKSFFGVQPKHNSCEQPMSYHDSVRGITMPSQGTPKAMLL